ncbi:MAG TPA: PQQ-binding-like beta-propeller repeat protein [Vicinamibacterales bacterium]|nr:PQQ-binding-like beta-propeller repeat protein [Vicinamibacterales bacterium]
MQSFPTATSWTIALSAAPQGPPVTAGDRIFFALESGIVQARSLERGAEIWTEKIQASGPIVADADVVVVPAQGTLHGLAAATGRKLWEMPLGELTAPALLRGGWLVVAVEDGLAAYRAADGVRLWRRAIGRIEERPAVDGPVLFVSVTDGRVAALELESGSPHWDRRVGSTPTEPYVLAERVYVGSNGRDLVCLRAATGEESWRFPIGAAVRGAAVADPSHVYVVAMDNLLRALHRTNGALKWKRDIRYRPSAGPFLLGRYVGVPGMTGVLRGFDALTGAPSGDLKLVDPLVTVPATSEPSGGRLAMIIGVTGNLRGQWTLVAATEPLPSLPVAPLKALPGTALPPLTPSGQAAPEPWPPARPG